MTTIPLGTGAYERLAAGVPEIVLLNRYAEVAPTNLREHSMLLARAATSPQLDLSPGAYTGSGPMRGQFAIGGLFDSSLFVVCGQQLYRVHPDMNVTVISGVISGTGHPEVAWQKGIGYERLFISDGLVLQFYAGTSPAMGTLTLTGAVVNGTDVFQIGGVYYGFGTVFAPTDAGTVSNPFIVNPAADTLGQVVLAIMDEGTPGVDYSATIAGANTLVMATENGGPPGTSVTLTSLKNDSSGNAVSTTVTGGVALSFGAPTLLGGGLDALQGVTVPDGVAVASLSQVSSYVLVSVAGSQKFFWINPGEIVIDPLDFAEKESSPDAITALRATGDQMNIFGETSTENWYATGNLQAPFAPIEGRVYQHGALEGTATVVGDAVLLVGDDGVAYSIGYQYGTASQWGVTRISNHGIEERIRKQLARENAISLQSRYLVTPSGVDLVTPGGVQLERPA